jgi:hypothetical protein
MVKTTVSDHHIQIGLAVEDMGIFVKLFPQGCVTLLNDIFSQVHILEVMQSIQTERPVIVSEQVVEVYCMLSAVHYTTNDLQI